MVVGAVSRLFVQAGTVTPAGNRTAPSWTPSSVVEVLNGTPEWFLSLFKSAAVLVLAYLVSQLLVELLGRRIARRFRRPSVSRMILRAIRGSVFLVAVLTILGIYGYDLSNVVLPITVFSAVVGVILAPIVASFISGVFLLADQPYEIGDMVELTDNGQRGFVEDITLRYTKIFTLDNTFLVIPNGTMRDRDVANYSAEDTRTRQSLDLLITYESDVDRARQLFENAARGVDGIVSGGPAIRVGGARYPAGPTCYIDEFGDHGINLRLRYWVEEPYWLLRIRSRIQTTLWDSLDGEDIEIAYPHQHHIFDETSGELQVATGDRPPQFDGGPGRPSSASPDRPVDGDRPPRRDPGDE